MIERRYVKKYGMFVLIVLCALLLASACTQAEPLEVFDSISSFELQSTTGDIYQSDNDKIKLISFILINCPDGVCPMTMADFTVLQGQLEEEGWLGTEVELLAITFDPERDDLEALREYGSNFDPNPEGWHFLRGSEEEIEKIADDLSYIYNIAEDGSAMHMMTMFLIDRDHQIRAFHRMTSSDEPMDHDLIMNHIERLVDEQ